MAGGVTSKFKTIRVTFTPPKIRFSIISKSVLIAYLFLLLSLFSFFFFFFEFQSICFNKNWIICYIQGSVQCSYLILFFFYIIPKVDGLYAELDIVNVASSTPLAFGVLQLSYALP